MIKRIGSGSYQLIQPSPQVRILILAKLSYKWIDNNLSTICYLPTKKDIILATNQYRLYKVKSETKFTPNFHLELHISNGFWQGYLLPNGFPKNQQIGQIFPIFEIITKSVFSKTKVPLPIVSHH